MKSDDGIPRGSHHGGSFSASGSGVDGTGAETMPADKMVGRHSVEGEVTRVDAKKGWVHVKTSDGTMIVHFPPSDLQTLKKGDLITVEPRPQGQRSRAEVSSAGPERAPRGRL